MVEERLDGRVDFVGRDGLEKGEGYKLLGAGYWFLAAGCWLLGAGCWVDHASIALTIFVVLIIKSNGAMEDTETCNRQLATCSIMQPVSLTVRQTVRH